MTITLLSIGKTNSPELIQLIQDYIGRLNHYSKFQFVIIPENKLHSKFSVEEQKIRESLMLLEYVEKFDMVIFLDENGKEMSSVDFSKMIENFGISAMSNIGFVIGGAFGIEYECFKSLKRYEKISLSKMTFSHQMVRLIFVEQLYRAFTIIKGEKYHHK